MLSNAGNSTRAFSRVRLSVLRDGIDDSEAGDRGNEEILKKYGLKNKNLKEKDSD